MPSAATRQPQDKDIQQDKNPSPTKKILLRNCTMTQHYTIHLSVILCKLTKLILSVQSLRSEREAYRLMLFASVSSGHSKIHQESQQQGEITEDIRCQHQRSLLLYRPTVIARRSLSYGRCCHIGSVGRLQIGCNNRSCETGINVLEQS